MVLTEDLIEAARAAGLRPKVAARPGGAERHRDAARATIRRATSAGWRPSGIVADARPGHVRVSPYFYNVADDHRAAIERLTRD